eukprot:m.126391 g.126391  ORF g.126391 m.126391 type:complete len:74 (+) comp9434_c1_seq33:1478-1699(+)
MLSAEAIAAIMQSSLRLNCKTKYYMQTIYVCTNLITNIAFFIQNKSNNAKMGLNNSNTSKMTQIFYETEYFPL